MEKNCIRQGAPLGAVNPCMISLNNVSCRSGVCVWCLVWWRCVVCRYLLLTPPPFCYQKLPPPRVGLGDYFLCPSSVCVSFPCVCEILSAPWCHSQLFYSFPMAYTLSYIHLSCNCVSSNCVSWVFLCLLCAWSLAAAWSCGQKLRWKKKRKERNEMFSYRRELHKSKSPRTVSMLSEKLLTKKLLLVAIIDVLAHGKKLM